MTDKRLVQNYYYNQKEIIKRFAIKHDIDEYDYNRGDHYYWSVGVYGIDVSDMIVDLLEKTDKDEYVSFCDFLSANDMVGSINYTNWVKFGGIKHKEEILKVLNVDG